MGTCNSLCPAVSCSLVGLSTLVKKLKAELNIVANEVKDKGFASQGTVDLLDWPPNRNLMPGLKQFSDKWQSTGRLTPAETGNVLEDKSKLER